MLQDHVVYVTHLPSSHVFNDGRIDPSSLHLIPEHFENYMHSHKLGFELSHSPEGKLNLCFCVEK